MRKPLIIVEKMYTIDGLFTIFFQKYEKHGL